MTEVNDTELVKICDASTSQAEKRLLIFEHFRRANNTKAVSVLVRLNEDAAQGLTNDEESKAIEELGRTGVPSTVGREIFNLFAKTNGNSIDDPSEIKLRRPGYKDLSNEAAAEDGAEASAGLNVDRTVNTVSPFASFDPLTAKSEFAGEDDDPAADGTKVKVPSPSFTIS